MTGGAVKARARELGFDKAGIARAGPAPRADSFRAWLGRSFHGGMSWLERAPGRRQDPAAVLPGVRSVVCVAMGYYSPGEPSRDPRTGRISRYAWGGDYHELLSARLGELRREIERAGGRAAAFVDSGAILEKPWAQQAGLGWQGKHSLLVSRDRGSWLFLGEVLTDLEMEPDAPWTEDLCGDCRRCLDACPTKAIVEPGVVDARRCLSYLTVEHRGSIPREFRPLMGNIIFGCDLCQEACPWNRSAGVAPERRFHAREENRAPSLVELRGLSPEGFGLRFQGSPVRRAGRGRFLRNVEAAMENAGVSA